VIEQYRTAVKVRGHRMKNVSFSACNSSGSVCYSYRRQRSQSAMAVRGMWVPGAGLKTVRGWSAWTRQLAARGLHCPL